MAKENNYMFRGQSSTSSSGTYGDIRSSSSKQKSYSQKFKREWLEVSQFRGWLVTHEKSKYLCKCKACEVELRCGKSELEKHAATEKHKKNVLKTRGQQSMSSFFQKETVHTRNVSEAEIKLANFFANHNVAFSVVEHLVPVLKDCFSDSSVAKDLKLGRSKTTEIVKNVLAKKETGDLVTELKRVYFSVLIDESTDISNNKIFCINVKYFDTHGKLNDRLLEIITLDAKDSSAEKLFAAFKQSFNTKQLPLNNIVGFASDNASVMVGKHNSFLTRLKSETYNLIVLPCICHSSALVANKSCSKLSRTPEEFLRSIAAYFSLSPKRTAELFEMQAFFHNEQKKMIKLSVTRWLCMQHAVKRVLENWQVLTAYFQTVVLEDNSKNVNFILSELNNHCTKAILLFLSYFLNFFNTFNALFQSKKLLVHLLSVECKKLFKQVIMHFVKPEYINNFKLNFKHPEHFLGIKSIDLGAECNSFLLTLPENIQLSIRKSCLDFLVTAASEMQDRFPLSDVFFESLQFLNPRVALNIQKPDNLNNLSSVWNALKSVPGIDGNLIDNQWRKLAVYFSDNDEKDPLLLKSVEEFWYTIGLYKNFQDEFEFENLSQLAKLCISLPHSNAETERVFSVVTDVKTKKRNKLSSEVLNSVAVIRFSSSTCCQSFKVTEDHLKLMSSKNLYS